MSQPVFRASVAAALILAGTVAHAWVWTSTDGVNYDAPLSARASRHAAISLVNGQYIAVGMMTMTSSDGVNWKQRLDQSSFGTIATHSVAGIPSRYSAGVANSAIYTSTDAIRWSYQSSLPPMGRTPLSRGEAIWRSRRSMVSSMLAVGTIAPTMASGWPVDCA